MGKTSALIYSRVLDDSVLGERKVGQKIGAILEVVILAATADVPNREHMIDFLGRLDGALRTDNSKSLDEILREFVTELGSATRDTEETGGNCCAEKTCECERNKYR